jgi:hypothetical protein
MMTTTLEQRIIPPLMLPDPRPLNIPELMQLFVEVSRYFTGQIADCKDVEVLEDLQLYMRAITSEIERKQKTEL